MTPKASVLGAKVSNTVAGGLKYLVRDGQAKPQPVPGDAAKGCSRHDSHTSMLQQARRKAAAIQTQSRLTDANQCEHARAGFGDAKA